MSVTTRQAREIALALHLIANRTGDDVTRLFRAVRPHLDMEPEESREVGFQIMEPGLADEQHFAIRTGEIAEALNERTETARQLKPRPWPKPEASEVAKPTKRRRV